MSDGYRSHGDYLVRDYCYGELGNRYSLKSATDEYYPVMQAVTNRAVGVSFIAYGDMQYDIKHPNVEFVTNATPVEVGV